MRLRSGLDSERSVIRGGNAGLSTLKLPGYW